MLTPFTTPLPALFGRLVLGLSNDRATPPSVGFVKKIFRVIYDMTKAKMAKYIGEAKAYYKGLRFVGLSADCWTSRVGQGFIGIEISFIFLDVSTGKCAMISMCLACVYLPGSHNAVNLAAKIAEVLAAFGLSALFVIIYVLDSGGGIPAAAKVMGVKRRGCLLHTADTMQGRALGEKGAHAADSTRHELKMLMGRVRGQAKVTEPFFLFFIRNARNDFM